jgi:hypothetical protein
MLSKRNCVKKAAIYLIVASMFVFIGSVVFAEECQLIQLSMEKQGAGSLVNIAPKSVTVPVGTCTVWVNFIKGSEVTVSFREKAKACMESTASQKEFGLFDIKPGESCFLSQPIGLGSTTSLIWSTPGEYKYTIQYVSKIPKEQLLGDVLGEGVIIVEKK